MTTDLLDRSAVISGFAAAYRENVIPDLASWSGKGERCALVTLVSVDGNAPRAEGAQMAVSESGRWAGYISGGCLEQAIALEAVEAIQAGKPRLLRYGKGSPYLDIRLPCGSGLDVFIQPMRDAATHQRYERTPGAAAAFRASDRSCDRRRPVAGVEQAPRFNLTARGASFSELTSLRCAVLSSAQARSLSPLRDWPLVRASRRNSTPPTQKVCQSCRFP